MTKQYVRYICNHIIFTVIIWLCVCVPNINGATDVYITEYGLYRTTYSGTDFHWDNISHATDVHITQRSCIYNYYSGAVAARVCEIPGDCFTSPSIDLNGACADISHTYTNIGTNTIQGVPFRYSYSGDISNTVFAFFYASGDNYVLTGNTMCVSSVSLYIYDGGWYIMNTTELNNDGDSYTFNVIDTYSYKVIFSDTYEQEFTVNSAHINYNYNACAKTTLNLFDDCANSLLNATTTVFVNTTTQIYHGKNNPIIILADGNYSQYDKLNIFIDTHNLVVEKTVYTDDPINVFNLHHNIVNWNLHTYVYDEDDHLPLNGVKVTHSQPCRIDGYDPNTFGFTNVYGFVSTPQLSNQNFSIKCEKENYVTFEHEYESNFAVWNPTYRINIDMAPDGSGTGNTTLPDLPCQIGWADDTGILISDITDAENARLYYIGGNCSNVLTWEKRDTVNHVWVLVQQWNIPANENGFKQFTSLNWTESETTRYRGTIFGYTCGCDASTDLTVTDSLDPQTVVNLTAGCFFRHGIGGSLMNPSSPIHILSYASSNNTTLVDIRLDLYNESVLVDTISYDFFDYYDDSEFIDLQWEPNYQYAMGFNYSVYMYCICEDVLVDIDTCYTNATGDNPFNTGNSLTVKVYDHNSLPLQYSTVYVESWGSMDTGAINEVTITGLGDDTYEYRAIKGGYLDRGFSSVTLTTDATVSYILDIIDTEHAIRDIKMADVDIKNMLYPIIFFILIMLLIGVLIDAVN